MNIHNNIHEMRIKLTCARWLESRDEWGTDGILINEFSSNKSKARADLAYVSASEVIAIEIKSSSDKIARLEGQIQFLKSAHNRVEVITTTKHYGKAREICAKENVGFHVVEGEEIVTILKGRRRRISEETLTSRLFPVNIKKRSDFSATEEYYRNFLIKKYGKVSRGEKSSNEAGIDALYIKSLNPHHIRRILAEQRRNDYKNDLRSLLSNIQSIHSSSNSSAETPVP